MYLVQKRHQYQTTEVHHIKLGSPSAWLYGRPGHWMLVDSGTKRTASLFMKRLRELGCCYSDIALAVLTHAHYDHVGALADILENEQFPVVIHKRDCYFIERGAFVMPRGFTLFAKVGAFCITHLLPSSFVSYKPFVADFPVKEEMRLDPFGFAATVIPTPGHSEGSLCILTDEGGVFSGDLIVNRPYCGIWKHMSPFGDSREEIKKQWRILIDRGAKTIYPGHGGAFPAKSLLDYL